MSEVIRWKLKGFIPEVEGVSEALFQPWVVPTEDFDGLQEKLKLAEQRLGDMEKALNRIARPLGCGCLPCHGDCTSKLALEITVEEMQETARSALKTPERKGQ